MARLWSLASDITNRVFGSKDIFHDRTEEEDIALQRAGEKIVPDLISGRFDAGLSAAFGASSSFRPTLKTYRGPVGAAEVEDGLRPQLVNAEAYRFSHYIAPQYPPLAMQARISGKVELELTVEPATGEVLAVTTVSGHRLLTPSAIDAARQWRFAPNSVGSKTLRLTLDFAFGCP
jgi:TonB family protein